MTYLSLLIIIIVFPFFLAFPVDFAIIEIIQATLNMSMMMMMMCKFSGRSAQDICHWAKYIFSL